MYCFILETTTRTSWLMVFAADFTGVVVWCGEALGEFTMIRRWTTGSMSVGAAMFGERFSTAPASRCFAPGR